MKTKLIRRIVVTLIVLLGKEYGYSQNPFLNLDFESPILPLIPDSSHFVPAMNAVPGWSVYDGNNPLNSVLFNTLSLGAPAVSFHSTVSGWAPIQGDYSVIIQQPTGAFLPNAAIAQTGQIPLSAISLIFYGTSLMQVTFNSQPLSLVQLGSAPNYAIMGADISAFAGQTGELRFQMPTLSFNAMSYLDNIQFSDQTIPEPGAVGLFATGTLLFGWRLRRK